MYTIGNRLKLSLFGKGHSECVGCIIEGLPFGTAVDSTHIAERMRFRRSSGDIGTARIEDDEVLVECGVTDGKVSGRYVMLTIRNNDVDRSAYAEIMTRPRPGHADLPAHMRFKGFDPTGGAQFSGRLTAPLVAAGAVAEQFLEGKGIRIAAYTRSISNIIDTEDRTFDEILQSRTFRTRAVTSEIDGMMAERILSAAKKGDSVGGTVGCITTGLEAGFGGIWFDGLDVGLSRAMFSIPAVKGVEFGRGFSITAMKGSQSNDQYAISNGRVVALSNNMGGVCGGMSDGMPLTFNVAFKPTPSILKVQRTVDLEEMTDCMLGIKGRHDPCIVPRAVSVVEAMTALTIMDQFLSFR